MCSITLYDVTTIFFAETHLSGYSPANHDAVIRFTARGTSTDMGRRYGAELATPTAKPDATYVDGIDIALRTVVHSLLSDVDTAYPQQVCKTHSNLLATFCTERRGIYLEHRLPPRQIHSHTRFHTTQ